MNDQATPVALPPPLPAGSAAPAATRLYAPLAGDRAGLRVLLVAPPEVPAWLVRFVAHAAGNDWLTLTLQPVIAARPDALATVPRGLHGFLARERARRPHGQAAFAPVALVGSDAVPSASVLEVDANLAALRARIAELQPELLLLLGPQPWATALAGCAERGCWQLDASLADADQAACALLAPVLRGQSETALTLELELPGRVALPLATTWGATCRASASRQRDQAFLKLPALLLRALRRVAEDARALPTRQPARLRLDPAQRPAGPALGVRALASTLAYRLAERWRRARQPFEDPWFVLLRDAGAPGAPLNPQLPTVDRHAVLEAAGGEIWADPCLVEDAGRRLLFVEETLQSTSKGVIACLELAQDGSARRLGLALEQPFHLSYPQVFRWDGHWYMTVESGQARRVSLYRAEGFPLHWQRVADLLDGCTCVDPTLHRHDGRWYLFVNIAESGGSTCDELFLFVADALAGPYRPHPANPIVADVRRARPAGRLFSHDGRLIRPAQDCAPSYGAAIAFNEVLELDPDHYRERPLGRLDASWAAGLDGCHTYSAIPGLEVLDARGVPSAGSTRLRVQATPD
jgi:hypothetical protein